MYLGWTCQLTHSNKYISFEYFESIVAPSTVLNRRIFLTTFFCLSWFSFYCQYCHQHTTFARSLHYFIIFDTCSNCVDRDCAQRKSESSKKTVTILSQFKLGLLPKEIIWYMVGTIPSHIRLSSNVKYYSMFTPAITAIGVGKVRSKNRQQSLLVTNWLVNSHYDLGTVSLVLMVKCMTRRVNFLQSSLASRSSRLMSRAKNSSICRESCARWRSGIVYWWEPLAVIPSSVLVIPYMIRAEVRMLMRSVSHVPMGISPRIWDHIGASPMLLLKIPYSYFWDLTSVQSNQGGEIQSNPGTKRYIPSGVCISAESSPRSI